MTTASREHQSEPREGPDQGGGIDIEAPLAAWRRRPLAAHAGAVLLLVLFAAVRWWSLLSFPGALNDEIVYLGAFERAAAGLSPFEEEGYLYPPLTALVGGWGVRHLGATAVLWFFRVANLLGLSATIWCALAWTPWRWRYRLLAGCLVLSFSPMARYGILFWNISLLIAGMMVVGLLAWRRFPVAAGLLLGASVAIKPMAPVAIAVLGVHRPRAGGRRHWLATGVAVAAAALLLLCLPRFDEMLALDVTDRIRRTSSLHRLPLLLGFEVSPLWVSGLLGCSALALARRRKMGPALLLAFALIATLAATPLVWSHALLGTLPVQAMALWVAWQRNRSSFRGRDQEARADGAGQAEPPNARRGRSRLRGRGPLYELALILLVVLGIQFAQGVTSVDDQGALFQFVGLLPTSLGPLALAAYLWFTTLAAGSSPEPSR